MNIYALPNLRIQTEDWMWNLASLLQIWRELHCQKSCSFEVQMHITLRHFNNSYECKTTLFSQRAIGPWKAFKAKIHTLSPTSQDLCHIISSFCTFTVTMNHEYQLLQSTTVKMYTVYLYAFMGTSALSKNWFCCVWRPLSAQPGSWSAIFSYKKDKNSCNRWSGPHRDCWVTPGLYQKRVYGRPKLQLKLHQL